MPIGNPLGFMGVARQDPQGAGVLPASLGIIKAGASGPVIPSFITLKAGGFLLLKTGDKILLKQ